MFFLWNPRPKNVQCLQINKTKNRSTPFHSYEIFFCWVSTFFGWKMCFAYGTVHRSFVHSANTQMHSIVSISCFHALLRITLNLTLCKSFNTAFVSFRASLSLSTRSFFLKPNKSARFWLPGLSATNKGEKQQKYQQNKRRKKSSCYFL